jgi:superfamily I DNA/RNA helicase
MESDIADIIAMRSEEAGIWDWSQDQLDKLVKAVTGQGKAPKWTREKMGLMAVELAKGYMKAHDLIYIDEVIPLATMAILDGTIPEAMWPEALAWDEYQDSTLEEDTLRQAMCAEHSFLVGDPRQAIYGFRGGDPMLLRVAYAESANLLSECWRCPADVIALANEIQEQFLPLRVARLDQTGPVVEIEADTDCRQITDYMAMHPGERTVVLCRSNARVRQLGAELRYAGCSVAELTKDADEYAGAPWSDAAYAVRLALEPRCEWVRWQVEQRGIPRLNLEHPDIATFGQAFPDIDDPHNDLTLPQWLAWYARRDAAERIEEMDADVVLMTVHAAKGLEFDHVAVDDIWHRYKENEESRAICYVAVTRCRKSLLKIKHMGWHQ